MEERKVEDPLPTETEPPQMREDRPAKRMRRTLNCDSLGEPFEVMYDDAVVTFHPTGNEFAHDILIYPSAIMAVAKRGSGKTFSQTAAITEAAMGGRAAEVVVFSHTAHLNGSYDWLDSSRVFPGFSDEVMQGFIDLMEQQLEERIRAYDTGESSSLEAPHLIVILDDVVGNTMAIGDEKSKASVGNTMTLNRLYAEGRHYKMTIILITQYQKVIASRLIRTNVDFLFMGPTTNENTDELNKLTMGMRHSTFQKFLFDATENNQLVLYDNKEKDNSRRWHVIKAEQSEPVRITFKSSKERKEKERKEEMIRRELEERQRRMEAQREEETAFMPDCGISLLRGLGQMGYRR